MPAFRWGHHWDALHDFEREVERLLRSVNLTFGGVRVARQYPPVNLYESDTEYLLTSELPGMRADHLELTIAGGVLTLKGRRNTENGASEDRYRRQERPHGSWQRSLTLPDRVDQNGLSAEFSNGVLKVHLPKAVEVEPRHIPVTEGNN